jgi:hypothetical protein
MADWVFINKSKQQKIVVRDVDSAMQLMQLIERTEKDSWEIQISTAPAPEAPQVAPPAPPVVATAAPVPAPPAAANWENRRVHDRYDLAYRILIIRGQHSYRSYTDNISLGGMLLKNPVPDKLLGEVCNIYIGHPNRRENIELTARVIGKGEASRRIAFTEIDAESKKLLEAWIHEARTEQQKSA